MSPFSSALPAPQKTPFSRFLSLIALDRRDLVTLALYALLAGTFSLVIPLTAQALVNTIAAGVFLQPLAALTLILFVTLVFVGALRAGQFYLAETIQRRLFARTALSLAENLPQIRHAVWIRAYLPEVVNRFFEVVTLQKIMAKLLLEGPAITLQIGGGLLLMALYSPALLGFDLLILAFMAFSALGLGRHAVKTSIQESAEKYHVAAWLEEAARCHTSMKIHSSADFVYQAIDTRVVGYLHSRRRHFRILLRQAIANYGFQAIASAGILGIGGWLVIHRQLTLGQLVASELVVLTLLSALDKLITMFQDWYDLLTALDKLGSVHDMPLERAEGEPLPEPSAHAGVRVACHEVGFSYDPARPIFQDLTLTISPGETVAIVGPSGSGKSTLAALLCGLLEPSQGRLELNDRDIRSLSLASLRQALALVSDTNEIFDGTVEDNIVMGRHHVSHDAVRQAVRQAQLWDTLHQLPNGFQTRLASAGSQLSRGQRQKLMIARALVDHPRLLVLDEAFSGIDARKKQRLLDALLSPECRATVLLISHDLDVVMRANRVLVLAEGRIIASGKPEALMQAPDSPLARLFPRWEVRDDAF